MSLDIPFYNELKRRKHPARHWWAAGDLLYYGGLLACLCAILWCIATFAFSLEPRSSQLIRSAVLLGGGIALHLAGSWSKARSHKMAMRDGIDVNEY